MGLFDQNYMVPSEQANAVRAYLGMYDGVEPSWCDKKRRYAPVHIAEWQNGRERGYVLMVTNSKREQMNIAFFEHRNSDDICAIKWLQSTINPPTIQNAKFGNVYKDKYDVSHSVGVGEAMEMADWIMDQLCQHWEDGLVADA